MEEIERLLNHVDIPFWSVKKITTKETLSEKCQEACMQAVLKEDAYQEYFQKKAQDIKGASAGHFYFQDFLGLSFCMMNFEEEDLYLIVGGNKIQSTNCENEVRTKNWQQFKKFLNEQPKKKKQEIEEIYEQLFEKIQANLFTEDKQLFQRLSDYLEKNLEKRHTLKSLSQVCYCSERKIQHLFATFAKKTFREFHLMLRMKQAKKWLTQKEKTIPEIAKALGYTHHSSFFRAFRKHFGLSPSEVDF